MLAYLNKPDLKSEVLATMAAHRKADELVQGYGYWKDGKGCAVGCLIKDGNGNHRAYEDKFGIPRTLAYLEDRIFEGLDKELAQQWPERFLGAINTGADLKLAVPKLMLWILTDPEGISKHARPDGLKAIKQVAALYEKKLAGDEPSSDEWMKARGLARADAYADADADADAAAAYADAAAAYAAAAAADAAYAAAAAADAAYAAYAAAAAADAAADAAAAAYAADAAAAAADAAYADAAAADAAADAAAAAYAADRKKYFARVADKLIEILMNTIPETSLQ